MEIRNQLALLRAEVNQISSQQSVDNRGRKRKYCQDETSDDDIVAIKRPSKQSTTISSLTTIRPSFEERQANREAERLELLEKRREEQLEREAHRKDLAEQRRLDREAEMAIREEKRRSDEYERHAKRLAEQRELDLQDEERRRQWKHQEMRIAQDTAMEEINAKERALERMRTQNYINAKELDEISHQRKKELLILEHNNRSDEGESRRKDRELEINLEIDNNNHVERVIHAKNKPKLLALSLNLTADEQN